MQKLMSLNNKTEICENKEQTKDERSQAFI